jgi:hypothetical protein
MTLLNLSSPSRPDRLWGPPNVLSNGYGGLFPLWWSVRCVKLTTHLQLVPRSRKVALYIPSPIRPYAFMEWCLIRSAQGQLYLLLLLDADHGGPTVWSMKSLRSLERLDRGFESHSKPWMSVCTLILCSCCLMCRYRPCDGLITRPRSPADCVQKITKLKKRPGPNKGL